jgi:hypothetical protein
MAGPFVADPKLANGDRHGAGWPVKMRPEDRPAAKAGLIPGTRSPTHMNTRWRPTISPVAGAGGCLPRRT